MPLGVSNERRREQEAMAKAAVMRNQYREVWVLAIWPPQKFAGFKVLNDR